MYLGGINKSLLIQLNVNYLISFLLKFSYEKQEKDSNRKKVNFSEEEKTKRNCCSGEPM